MPLFDLEWLKRGSINAQVFENQGRTAWLSAAIWSGSLYYYHTRIFRNNRAKGYYLLFAMASLWASTQYSALALYPIMDELKMTDKLKEENHQEKM